MDKIQKLLKKISTKNRQALLNIIEILVSGQKKGLNIVKIKGSDFFRLRNGNFRIIFHYESKEVIIDSIKVRNEKTYKKLK